jgi:putative transposase
MHLIPGEVYHIYNRGNNKQPIFFSEANYKFFRKKIEDHLKPICDILCWTLMPNHFHLIIHANELSCSERIAFGGKHMQEFSYRVGTMLSSYSQAINNQNGTTGSLFQQKTKVKDLSNDEDYLISCMHYIHQNPLRAGLVKKIEDWPWTSFLDYAGLRNDALCNKELLLQLTGYDLENFYRDSYNIIDGDNFKML